MGETSRTGLLEKYQFKEEVKEVISGKLGKTGFPEPLKYYQLFWEVYDLSMEEPYFWIVDFLKDKFITVEKMEDSFAAAENSAFFGITQQRLGAQQDKVSQFLATVGKMIKELFQMVRELRIIDERLKYYNGVGAELEKPLDQRRKGDEVTLKGFFIDLVQGGAKSAASVFGMSRELEFITLPDLFFDAPPFKTQDELEGFVEELGKDFNRNVLRVLLRHLTQYTEWRKRTHQEHQNRRRFQKAYLKQHFDIIKMYVEWVKPYLRHVSRMHMKEERLSSADIVMAFEGSMLDVEVLFRNQEKISGQGYNACVLATFNYRTRPEMKVVQEGYQRGPVHVGRFEVNLRQYWWTDEEVEAYRKLKEEETVWLMGEVSSSIKEAMESLGEELDKYLEEIRMEKEMGKEKPEKEAPKKSFLEKFLGDFYVPSEQKKAAAKVSTLKKADKTAVEAKKEKMMKEAGGACWGAYHYFKKAHRMVAW